MEYAIFVACAAKDAGRKRFRNCKPDASSALVVPEPAIMRTWLPRVVDADVRVGGRYRLENHDADVINLHRGQYLALEPGQLFLMTVRHDATKPGTSEDE